MTDNEELEETDPIYLRYSFALDLIQTLSDAQASLNKLASEIQGVKDSEDFGTALTNVTYALGLCNDVKAGTYKDEIDGN